MNSRKRRITKSCNFCGKSHEIIPSDIKFGKDKYCSRECRYTANGLKSRNGSTVECLTCSKSVYRPAYRLKRENYCSPECQHKSLIKHGFADCGACGRSFKKTIEASKYCSIECRAVGNSGANNPKSSHLMSQTRIYRIWSMMKDRCYNPANHRYADWGGRGIGVCDRWRYSFENFYADMGDRPEGKTLDRIDNDADYSPDNCRWATYLEQNQNKRAKA